MGWEMRSRGGLYYTRSIRINGRVVRQYIGTGEAAMLAAQQDATERAERRARAAAWAQERAELESADASIEELDEVAELVMAGVLLCSGYHRHNRGEWRLRRGQ